MKRIQIVLLIIIFLVIYSPVTRQIYKDYWKNQEKAFAASSDAECQSSLQFCNEVLKDIPNHAVINYLVARLNEQLGNHNISLKHLRKASKLGYTSNTRWLKIKQMVDRT